MAKGGGSIHIDRPADGVFAFVAEAENNPRWRWYFRMSIRLRAEGSSWVG